MAIKLEGNVLVMHKGDSAQLELQVYDDTVKYDLEPGDQVVFDLRRLDTDTESLLTKTVTEFVDGVAHIQFAVNDTAAMEIGLYKYQVKIILVDRGTHTVLDGNFKLINWKL